MKTIREWVVDIAYGAIVGLSIAAVMAPVMIMVVGKVWMHP